MTRTVVALYDDFTSANAAVRDLVDRGFSRDDISLMASDASGEYSQYVNRDVADTSGAAEGAGVGAGIGAVIGGLGGLLVGLGALTIPGIGPVLAAGPLSAALTGLAGAGVGAVAGGVTGGLLGALVDLGIPEDTAHYYAEGIRRGGSLVTIRTDDDRTNMAVDILNRHNPVDINQRAAQWREGGWTGFDANAETYRAPTTGLAGTAAGMPRTASDNPITDAPRGAFHPEEGSDMSTPRFKEERSDLYRPEMGGETVDNPVTDYPRGTYHPEEGSDMSTPRFSEDRPDLYRPERGGESPDEPIIGKFNDFDDYDTRFRSHFETTTSGMGYRYDQYQPAYRYGYELARDARYRDYDWDRLEPEAHRYWDERNPGSWERFKGAVRHAWEEIKESVD